VNRRDFTLLVVLALVALWGGVACAKPLVVHGSGGSPPADTTPPTLQSAVIEENGTTWTLTFSEPVVANNSDGFAGTPSGGAATLTLSGGSETAAMDLTSNRTIQDAETATIAYNDAAGDVEDLAGNDLATFAATSVTNNSNQDPNPYLPHAPETFTVPYSLPVGGTTYTPVDSAALTTALAAADGNDIIVLAAGTTYTGNFKLRNWGAGTDWVYIISSDMADLPAEGERVAIADAVDMPTITSSNSNPGLHSDFGAHHYRIAGVQITRGANDRIAAVQFGYGGDFLTHADEDSELVHHITVDRCLIRSTSDAHRLRHGMIFNGKYMACVDSYIGNVKDTADAQCIFAFNGPGPYLIENNFLEATGMSVMFGGTDPRITDQVPSDIVVRGNYCYKPLSWKDANLWDVKNLFELKNAQRVLVTGNVMENCWTDGQTGFAVLLTPRNQGGSAPWSVTKDIDFENNIVKNVGSFINIASNDDINTSAQTERVRVHNNLILDVTRDYNSGPVFIKTGAPRGIASEYVTITHNTCLCPSDELPPGNHIKFNSSGVNVDHLIVQDNLMVHGGNNPLWVQSSNSTHTNNVWVMFAAEARYAFNKANFPTFHPGDQMADPELASVGFEDLGGGDYRLDALSPFVGDGTGGSDPGADIDELEAATAGAESGVWP
jgi:hypothetical protein